ncbi:uncharacterized protein LOC112348082 [Selaginella moellendorffii]|uniref:uncharacterized protein LOC112348082 n=1 Tax=Selaginella moellendorffii TaxID=88036 RepID=UPI000D1CB205|nr:uncharacterized protein LOC112348082 [Selaginella moellendorffii]|eukprot:XP_024535901.1 uncharacterized protein LOC112348082 [Selaginella moellendorffii]
MVFGIQSWGVKQGGPMLVAAYQPLETIITIILAFFLLRESLNLGSLVGGSIILLGLYLVVWGKEREQRFDALCVVQDFQGMANFAPRPSNFSVGMTTEITVASSATRSVFGGPLSIELQVDNADDEEEEEHDPAAWFANNDQPLSMERSAAWVFTQPLFARDDHSSQSCRAANGRDKNHKLVPLSRQRTLDGSNWLDESTLKACDSEDGNRSHVADNNSDSSGEMASTRSDFSSKWNYGGRTMANSRANSVRSVPSRLSVSTIAPSRVNSVRSIASRMATAKVSDSSSESGHVNSSRTSTSSN